MFTTQSIVKAAIPHRGALPVQTARPLSVFKKVSLSVSAPTKAQNESVTFGCPSRFFVPPLPYMGDGLG
jgi:hypothetical protein